MPRPLAPNGAWPLIAVAAALAAALAAGCTAKTRTVGGPSGTGGTLTASISASATSGRAPIDVTFTSDVHGGDGPYEYLWTFGDGRTSSAANPHVQFLNGGTFCLFDDCSYSGDFGGAGSGHATETARPLFTYAAGGTYTASLNASTGGRGGPSASCKVTVTVP